MYSTEISDLRARLLVRLQKVQDATTLHEIEQLLEENAENTARDDQYDQLIEEVLAEYTKTDEPLTYKSKLDNTGTIARFENLRVPLFFWNSIFSLLIFGLMISFQWEDGSLEMRWLTHLVYGLYLLTMGISAFEVFVLRILHRKHPSEPARKREWSYRLLAILLPPLRMGMRRLGNRDWLWLPRLGWAKANAALFTKLKKDFGTPMIVIALLIIPIFLIEWKLSDYMAENYPAFELEFWLGIAGAFIWIAFTLEFIIMIGVTNEKVDYCKRNWIDLFIIILPLLSFFPTLQILRVARLNQLVRVYRVRGLTMKIKEAFVLLAVFQRILYPNPTAQLQSLQKKLRNNRRQKEQLEEQVMYAVKRLRRKHEKKKI
ncbi:MAG: hypothetical protein AAF740_14990 [Bacteroidota bacterium]